MKSAPAFLCRLVAAVHFAGTLFTGAGPRAQAAPAANSRFVIVHTDPPSALEQFAAKEVRRYVYLRAGQLLPILTAHGELPGNPNLILLAPSRHPLARTLARRGGFEVEAMFLGPDAYLIRTFNWEGQTIWLLTASTDTGLLYAAYRFAEHLGVRFYLDADVVPDQRLPLAPPVTEWPNVGQQMLQPQGAVFAGLPVMNEQAQPLFALRGIQPFHDFPEGPDWWNADDYLAVLSQLPKLRMNFFGLHTYPEKRPNAEPTVWIGLRQDADAAGQVKFSYPASYMNTLRGNWGYAAKLTGAYALGAKNLFERDAFGPEVMGDWLPEPKTPEACNEVFNRTAAMLRQAFEHARRLGVKTCVGTETPLIIPDQVKERLKSLGRNPDDLAVAQEVYAGIFARIASAYPLDYFWFWTPEGWTWEGAKPEQVRATTNDLFAAIAAAQQVNAPFKLATCGWVLGPQSDRSLFDKVLPKDVAVSCINREVGKTPVEKGFANVQGRGKWAIPWLEDDPALTAPQLWVGRMRRDARDALAYGCDGLMGIHWRTRVLGPAVSALANAAWDQSWAKFTAPAPPKVAGPVGGQMAAFPGHAIADTEEDTVYQTVRYNVSAYHLSLNNGTYKVTLQFCEPHYDQAGKRVFGVRVQGQSAITGLDIFAKVGKDRALDFTYDQVAVTNGWLDLEFVPEVEFPSIAGIVVQKDGFAQKINCGGPAYKDYLADWPAGAAPAEVLPPVEDFYRDWARQQFGPEVAAPLARIFASVDGRLPRPADWVNGPGGIRPDPRPWSQVSTNYQFVKQMAACERQVVGKGNQERFAYWLNTFRYLEAMAQINCTWAELNAALARAKADADPAAKQELARQQALPLRKQLVRQVETLYRHLLAKVSNPGELGTIANWEQHLFPDLLDKTGKELAALLGTELPADARLAQEYSGPTRVIVPTKRTSFLRGEELRLKVLVLSACPPREASLFCRKMGQGAWARLPLTRVARSVYEVKLPTAKALDDLEYYVEVKPHAEAPVHFPATAPNQCQTLVLQPR